MKSIYIVILSLTVVTKCHVLNREKNRDVTTQFPIENETPSQDKSKRTNESSQLQSKTPKENSVYVEDVIFTLKNQNWAEEEEECVDQIFLLLYSLQNFTLWAVWDWDAQSSEPQGLLYGNRYQLGNFDECMNAPWAATHSELSTKYCLAEIKLERSDKAVKKKIDAPIDPYQSALDFIEYHPPHTRPLNELTWGACVPASCPPRTVERLMAIMLARSHLGAAGMRANISVTEECQMSGKRNEFDALFYSFLCVIGLLTLICLIGTYLNTREIKLDPNKKSTEIIKAVCLKENYLNLLNMKKEGIEVFYGIRFLTICLIVLDHQMGIFNAGPMSDGTSTDQIFLSALGALVLHNDLFVDTFFLLSGFLTAHNFLKFKRFPNPILIIVKRYVRLVVALAVVMFYVTAVLQHTGSGPLWTRAVKFEADLCRKNWWLNLLMISNYVDYQNMCLVVSWYIPCDFHYYIVATLLFWMYKRCPRPSLICAGLITLVLFVLPGVICYVYHTPAIQLFTYEFISNPRMNAQFGATYIKSHLRAAPYIVGFFSGCLFSKYSADGNLNKINKKWSTLSTYLALVLMLVVMVIGSTFIWHSYHPLVSAAYAALNRPVWALGVVIVVMCCSFGHVPLIKRFLSWYPWVPLSRLAYGLYLSHPILITKNVFGTRNPQNNDLFEVLNQATGIVVWGCLISFVIWLIAEAPANNLLSLCMRPRKKVTKPENNMDRHPTPSPAQPGGNGHLQDNLPSSIYISSKI